MNMQISALCVAAALLSGVHGGADAAESCGTPGILKGKKGDAVIELKARLFADGSIAVRAPLAVNPDGGPGSYTVGDHGFTYIANGLARWRNGGRETCDSACAASFKAAEKVGFAKGTEEFCVFAMAVEPVEPGKAKVPCTRGEVVGNGKGRLVLGEVLPAIGGGTVQAYASTTSLQHVVGGRRVYLNSETLPIAVTPSADLLGRAVWVGGVGMNPTFAVVGDAGPAFGEGSIALHQLLRRGAVARQSVGPIPLDKRCQAGETGLTAPFQSRPDGGPADRCRAGYTVKTGSDVRAYSGIHQPIDFVILGAAAFERKGNTIQSEVTTDAIQQLAVTAGYTDDKIKQMISCLAQ